jgi:2-(1,2-epoxy-1,2-dihydrophenyl)acetyl-CoA isomerase
MADDVLIEKRADGVALITLNRPESLNAMGGQLMPMLADYLADTANDRRVRCVVLTGAGRGFCAGGDVKGMAAGRDALLNAGGENGQRSPALDFARGVEGLRDSQRHTSLMLHTRPKPTIAMVNGHAVGAGLSLALACDLRVASDRAKLGTIFRNVGFSGDFGGSYFLQKLVGSGKARELYFTGEILDAEAALAIGMVNRVVPQDQLMAEAEKLARDMKGTPMDVMFALADEVEVEKVPGRRKIAGHDCDRYSLSLGDALEIEIGAAPGLKPPTPAVYDARKAGYAAAGPMGAGF